MFVQRQKTDMLSYLGVFNQREESGVLHLTFPSLFSFFFQLYFLFLAFSSSSFFLFLSLSSPLLLYNFCSILFKFFFSEQPPLPGSLPLFPLTANEAKLSNILFVRVCHFLTQWHLVHTIIRSLLFSSFSLLFAHHLL